VLNSSTEPTQREGRELFDVVCEECESTRLIVSCALTPCHEHRAANAIGRAGVEHIQRVARKYGWSYQNPYPRKVNL
jgi:hypothetical protein